MVLLHRCAEHAPQVLSPASRHRNNVEDVTAVTHCCMEVGFMMTASKPYVLKHVLLLRVHISLATIATYLYLYAGHAQRRSDAKCVANSGTHAGVFPYSELSCGIAFSTERTSKTDNVIFFSIVHLVAIAFVTHNPRRCTPAFPESRHSFS